MLARLFSKRIRELEEINSEMRLMIEGKFGDLRLTRANFENGHFGADFLHEGFAGILAAWGFNALKSCGAENYVTIEVVHAGGSEGAVLPPEER